MNKKEKFTKHLKRTMNNGLFILFFLMFIESIRFNRKDTNIVGIMFLSNSIVFFPWLKNILKHFKLKLEFRQKLLIFILNFLIAIIAMSLKKFNYIYLIVEFVLIDIVWFLVIYISNKNKREVNYL